jgi:hypothetical protein
MSSPKILAASVLIPLLFGFIALVYTGVLSSGSAGGGYGVLSLDEAVPEAAVTGALNGNGLEGIISESSQWVFLDDFGSLERIPLTEYWERIESFDLRNDGYAEELRAFFVRDGRRFLYIPLSSPKKLSLFDNGYGALQREVALALGDTPYSLTLPRSPRPLAWYGILFGCAAAGTLILSVFPQGRAGRALIPALSLLPLTVPLALWGSTGFALSGALFGVFGVTLAPLREFFVSRCYGRLSFSSRTGDIQWGSYRVSWLLAGVFLLIYGFICFTGKTPVLISLAVPVSFFCVLAAALWAGAAREKLRDHVRFLPVEIRDRPMGFFQFPRIVLPFALISLAALAPASSAGESGGGMADFPLPPVDYYYRHAAFQASFSLRPLGVVPEGIPLPEAGTGARPYLRYTLGDDGLIAGGVSPLGREEYPEAGEFPPFPLEDLAAFLGGGAFRPASERGEAGELAPVFIILVPGLLSLFHTGKPYRKKSGVLLYADKRAAA